MRFLVTKCGVFISILFVAITPVYSMNNGSIPLDGKNITEAQMSELASVGISDAIAAANRTAKGKVIRAALDDENGFLVWEVEVLTSPNNIQQLSIDAGTGTVLTIKQDSPDSWWKFWDN